MYIVQTERHFSKPVRSGMTFNCRFRATLLIDGIVPVAGVTLEGRE